MPNTVVLGLQWGDEGKGKIVDLICPSFELVARYQGGHNAGHTVKFGDRHFALHLIPSGIVRQDATCVLGNGMVVSPEAFFEELESLRDLGVEAEGRLFVSRRAQVLLPHHAELDSLREEAMGASRIGTTARGIGPAYECKAARLGVRMCDLTSGSLAQRVGLQLARLAPEFRHLRGDDGPDARQVVAACRTWGERLAPFQRDTERLLADAMAEGRSVLFEGAQGTLLDVDFGTYPYVTSSSATAGGVCSGAGVPPTCLDGVVGVLKAYTTRVGQGPFPSELEDADGSYLRERGNEFGTTTGRPRRCGWLDLVAARYTAMLNGASVIALTKLDVLDQFEEIKVCTAYRVDGEVLTDFPPDIEVLERAEPVLETVPGWHQPTDGALALDALPEAARDYVALIEREVGAPVGIISTGPRREESLVREIDAVRRLTGL